MKATAVVVVVAAVAGVGGYLAGYLPAAGRLGEAELALGTAQEELRAVRESLRAARALVDLHALHDEVQALVEETDDPSRFEAAQARSTAFFDLVRAEAAKAVGPREKGALADILGRRDAVTAGLATRDPVVRARLREIRALLQPLLVPPAAAPGGVGPSGASGPVPPGGL